MIGCEGDPAHDLRRPRAPGPPRPVARAGVRCYRLERELPSPLESPNRAAMSSRVSRGGLTSSPSISGRKPSAARTWTCATGTSSLETLSPARTRLMYSAGLIGTRSAQAPRSLTTSGRARQAVMTSIPAVVAKPAATPRRDSFRNRTPSGSRTHPSCSPGWLLGRGRGRARGWPAGQQRGGSARVRGPCRPRTRVRACRG